MNIGEAARQSGVSAKMVRYYEQIGLVPAAERRGSGYRDFSDEDVHRLRFIARARDLGFPVAGIAELLGLWSDTARHSADVRKIARAHIADLNAKIDGLRDMAATLQALVDRCSGDDRPSCPILSALEERTGPQADVRRPALQGRRRSA